MPVPFVEMETDGFARWMQTQGSSFTFYVRQMHEADVCYAWKCQSDLLLSNYTLVLKNFAKITITSSTI